MLGAGLAGGLGLVFGLLWRAPDLLLAVPAAVLAVGALVYLVRRPLVHLAAVLLGSVLILQHEPGVQASEVLYGLYAALFLLAWAVEQVMVQRAPVFASRESRALLLFLALVAALIPVSFLLGATVHTVSREVIALVMLGFFFPIREACVRFEHGARVVLLVALALSLFVVVRNALLYRALLGSVEGLYEIALGRIIVNDHVLAASSLVTFVFLTHVRSARQIAGWLGAFLLCFGGLLLTQSRGFWIAFALGVAFVFAVVDWRQKGRLVLLGVGASVAALVVGAAVSSDFVGLLAESLSDRLLSVQGSLSRDVSLVSRLYEARGVLAGIAQNPLLGHGLGVPFTYTDILTRTTGSSTFTHNGYLSLWYRFGVVGAALVLYWWGRSAACGLRVYADRAAPMVLRLVGLGTAAALVGFTLSALTSNPFWHKDYLFGFAYVAALACGANARAQTLAAPARPAPARPALAASPPAGARR